MAPAALRGRTPCGLHAAADCRVGSVNFLMHGHTGVGIIRRAVACSVGNSECRNPFMTYVASSLMPVLAVVVASGPLSGIRRCLQVFPASG